MVKLGSSQPHSRIQCFYRVSQSSGVQAMEPPVPQFNPFCLLQYQYFIYLMLKEALVSQSLDQNLSSIF